MAANASIRQTRTRKSGTHLGVNVLLVAVPGDRFLGACLVHR